MSRIGKTPIPLPNGVNFSNENGFVTVKGPKGTLSRQVSPDMILEVDSDTLTVARPSDAKDHRSQHGLTRTLIANMVTGVTTGFTRVLEVQGTGYRAAMAGKQLVLSVGYSHQVPVDPPEGIAFAVEGTNRININGIDKELVGQTAANIRAVRKPEPYKGKGIRYQGEVVRMKAGKAGKAGGKKK